MKKYSQFFIFLALLLVLSPQIQFAQSKEVNFLLTIHITLSTGLPPVDVVVSVNTYFVLTDSSGVAVFDSITEGYYDITAFKIGYDEYTLNNAIITEDKVINIMLSDKKYPPTCLVVDPVSLEATWCEPLRTAIDQDFEYPVFPPAGWQSLSQQQGWVRTNNGSSGGWTIPDWDNFYAMANDDANGGSGYGCCDYLITRAVDLRESEGYILSFNSFYDGSYGQLAFVEYSLDGCETWEVMYQVIPVQDWDFLTFDLGAFSGPTGPEQIWFAFHADDAGAWASGWAIDNVKIQVPDQPANYIDFWVFLNDTLVGVTTNLNWDFAPLLYGQTHTASVAARYSSGLSSKDYYTFSCEYLFPPDSLIASAPDDAAILDWTPPIELWPVLTTAGMSYEDYLAENNLQNNRSNDALSSGRAPNTNINVPDVNPFAGLRDLESKAWACDALANSMVTFTLGTPGTLNPLGPGAADFISAADIVDGVYYGTIYGGTFVTMDTATGVFTTIGTTADLTGLAYDYTTETMFGVDFFGNLYTIDLQTGAPTIVGNTGGVLIDCACDNAGMLFAVDIGSDVFGSIDKTVATFTTISNLPFDANYFQGMQCDHGSNLVYHAAYNNALGAGQLYEVDQATGAYTLIGNFQGNTEVDGFAIPYAGGGLIGVLPENLLGYNIYRNGSFVDYTPHTPPGENVHQGYVDEGIQPGYYEYTVTAVYDLTPYGFPGDSAESFEEGPAILTAGCCFELDFMEPWEQGNFEDNNWFIDGNNWSVNGQAGSPSPAAEFTWDPVQENYSIALESYSFTAVGMTEGKIFMDFDLKLDAVVPTGEERLIVGVLWDWESQVWDTVAEYSNVEGSFGWSAEHIDITSSSMGKVFRIRFLATGTNSLNILSWFLDNIHIYRSCEAPSNLVYEFFSNGVMLTWVPPGPGNNDGFKPGYGASEALAGYNIYRSKDSEEYILLDFSDEPAYFDTGDDLLQSSYYCYMVSAVWESETDQCESSFSNEACMIVGIKSPDPEPAFSIYPNPASDYLSIIPEKKLSGNEIIVSLYNAAGVLILTREFYIDGAEMRLNLEGYPAGIYWVSIRSNSKHDKAFKLIIL